MPDSNSKSSKDKENDHRSPAEKYFADCQLEPVVDDPASKIVVSTEYMDDGDGLDGGGIDGDDDDNNSMGETTTIFATTSFYLDASGRSKMSLPLKFTFATQEALDHYLAHDCIHPVPHNVVQEEDAADAAEGGEEDGEEKEEGEDEGEEGEDEEEEEGEEEEGFSKKKKKSSSKGDSKTALGFEVTTVAVAAADSQMDLHASMKSVYSTVSHSHHHPQSSNSLPTLQQNRAIVEGITVTSSRIEGTSILFDTQVIVRAAQHSSLMIKTRLHVVAVLSEQPRDPPTQESRMSYKGFPDFTLQTTLTASKVKHTRLQPFLLEVTLTDALAIDVTSVTGPTTGRTLISLVMRHPNTHSEPVTITNIALHPGHSRLELPAPPGAPSSLGHNNSAPAIHTVVADMSQCVQWGYAPQTQPKVPMTLYPQGAFATILTVDAMEHMRSRTFKSPVSVTAVVGSQSQNKEEEDDNDANKANAPVATPKTISSADAQWTTGRLAQEPSDAFRIDMQLQNKDFYVGEPFTIFLRVTNLSADARDMMLLVAKDSDKHANATGTTTNKTSSSLFSATALAQPTSNNLNASSHHSGANGSGAARDSIPYLQQQQQRSNIPNTAVVSEVNGYTFGVWGLIADADSPVFRLDRDQDLLAIDAALLLGEIKGHHSVEAQLRFNPLREGTLDVPNMQLFDKRNRKWYYCTHKLNIVARQKRSNEEGGGGGDDN